ncbi:uncharacterized protein LOC112189585 isoform X2 [Rosa chinensis]|uniref:uncharacterized protein LOC112189585 isoform X2 n=1 Tax=Rosa chinensis TaxID=74649 RepID=UPI001AD8EDE7|nr:uncharacterized protein LOC112189585 isoform X2 [Rosa chinensis]
MAGVRVVGGRIYDSENGKTCHQCRQKTRDFVASCKNLKKKARCTISFCHKCLLNRYGEKAEEVELLEDWNCPKCRGNCNCSFCRKKQGLKPTGLLVHTAKEGGFGSVSEMLTARGPENFGIERKVAEKVAVDGKENSVDQKIEASLNSTQNPEEGQVKKTKRKGLKEIRNGSRDDPKVSEDGSRDDPKVPEDGSRDDPKVSKDVAVKEVKSRKRKNKDRREEADDAKLQGEEVQNVVNNNDVKRKKKAKDKVKSSKETCRVEECTKNILNKKVEPELPLPEGIPLTSVLGIELPPEDAGNALQFMEFCSAFGEVLKFKKAQAESIIGELLRQRSGRAGRPGQYSSLIRFHMQLLSLLQEDMGEEPSSIDEMSHKNSWFQDLGKCISESESEHLLKELPTDCFSRGGAGYDILDLSQKLRLLTYLCDEVICTSKLRSWIEEQHEKIVESEKEAKGKVNAAKDKEKLLKRKLQDEVAKLIIAKNGAPLSISEHEALVSQIKSEAAQAHAELLEAEGIVPKKKHRRDALRTEPYRVDVDGRIFLKLKGYNNGEDIVLQDLGAWDAVVSKEEWFVYGAETKEAIENYCSSLRRKKSSGTMSQTVPRESDEENM